MEEEENACYQYGPSVLVCSTRMDGRPKVNYIAASASITRPLRLTSQITRNQLPNHSHQHGYVSHISQKCRGVEKKFSVSKTWGREDFVYSRMEQQPVAQQGCQAVTTAPIFHLFEWNCHQRRDSCVFKELLENAPETSLGLVRPGTWTGLGLLL